MFSLFRKNRLVALAALLSLNTISSSLMAWDCCDPCQSNRMYVGAFGGGLYSDSTQVTQLGTAFFSEESSVGGPLAVHAGGKTRSTSSGFGGIQLGYEWSQCPITIGCSEWSLAPAVELEAFWYKHRKKGHLINSIGTLDEHDFADSFKMNSGVYLVNAVFSLNSPCLGSFTPYVGGGIGATRISINSASSIQTSPAEPGINHFNTKRSDSSWAFAAQIKAGLRYNFCQAFHFFGEYRYLFVDTTNYIFGSTSYPAHVPTSPWNVQVKNIHYNAFVFGIQYDL